MYGYIYITTNRINGKIYIGQHKSSIYHPWYLGSGKYLGRALKKYGRENFENHIIQWCKDKNELCEKEKYWIRKYNSLDNEVGYNITPGGEFGDITAGMTKEDYEKWRLKFRGKNNPIYKSGERGLHPKGMLGKHHTEKTKKRLKECFSGEKNPFYKKNWKDYGGHPKGMLGKHHTNTNWRHQLENKVILQNGNEYTFSNLSKAARELKIPRNVLQKALITSRPYKNPQNFPQYSIYNGVVVLKLDNTEITK